MLRANQAKQCPAKHRLRTRLYSFSLQQYWLFCAEPISVILCVLLMWWTLLLSCRFAVLPCIALCSIRTHSWNFVYKSYVDRTNCTVFNFLCYYLVIEAYFTRQVKCNTFMTWFVTVKNKIHCCYHSAIQWLKGIATHRFVSYVIQTQFVEVHMFTWFKCVMCF